MCMVCGSQEFLSSNEFLQILSFEFVERNARNNGAMIGLQILRKPSRAEFITIGMLYNYMQCESSNDKYQNFMLCYYQRYVHLMFNT